MKNDMGRRRMLKKKTEEGKNRKIGKMSKKWEGRIKEEDWD